jgi:hypothetical protein
VSHGSLPPKLFYVFLLSWDLWGGASRASYMYIYTHTHIYAYIYIYIYIICIYICIHKYEKDVNHELHVLAGVFHMG